MKHIRALATGLVLLLVASPAAAGCYADYKAKKDDPLRLQYGIVELPTNACGDMNATTRYTEPLLRRHGWTLLQIESTFGPEGFAERRARAGEIHFRE